MINSLEMHVFKLASQPRVAAASRQIMRLQLPRLSSIGTVAACRRSVFAVLIFDNHAVSTARPFRPQARTHN